MPTNMLQGLEVGRRYQTVPPGEGLFDAFDWCEGKAILGAVTLTVLPVVITLLVA
jgi:hypothetical protein